jgi:hypothetical protein
MSLTLATADAALKEDYQPSMREQLNNACVILEQIEANSKDVEGRRAVLSLHVRRNSGVGARAEGGTLPTAGRQGYTEERVLLRYNYGRIMLTGPVIRAMKSDKGSFVRAVDSETKGVVRDLKRNVNRQVFGTSNGVIVQVGAGSTTTVVNFHASATEAQKRQIEVGAVIDIGTASPFTSVGTAREVTAVTSTNFTVTPAFAGPPAANDSVVTSGSGGSGAAQKELTGLQSIVAATGALFNVDPATTPVWASTVLANGGTPRAITETLLGRALHANQIAGGSDIELFVTSDGVERAYAGVLQANKRFPNTLDLKGGYKAISVSAGGHEVGLLWDRDAPNGRIFGLALSHLTQQQASDWEWMDEDGAVLSRVSGVDAYEATLFKYHELTTDKRNAHTLITDIIEA